MRYYTTPYTPQQNGVVEHRNRTVMAMVRSLLKERQVPTKYWGEAVRHAVQVLNKLRTRLLSSITPYEAWYNRKPSVEHLKISSCTAYMKIPSVHTTKLEDRSKLVVHFGREPGTKAYRLFDPDTNRIHVSRDVKSNEDQAWTWASLNTSGPSGPGHYTLDISATVPTITPEEASELQTSPTISRPITDPTLDTSEPPRKYKSLTEIYDHTTEVELPEEELFLMGIDEPLCFEQAV